MKKVKFFIGMFALFALGMSFLACNHETLSTGTTSGTTTAETWTEIQKSEITLEDGAYSVEMHTRNFLEAQYSVNMKSTGNKMTGFITVLLSYSKPYSFRRASYSYVYEYSSPETYQSEKEKNQGKSDYTFNDNDLSIIQSLSPLSSSDYDKLDNVIKLLTTHYSDAYDESTYGKNEIKYYFSSAKNYKIETSASLNGNETIRTTSLISRLK